MKSVTVKIKGNVLLRVTEHKDGTFSYILDDRYLDLTIDARTNNNKKVIWVRGNVPYCYRGGMK